MKTLPRSDFDRAVAYLKNQARPLERRLFAFYFEDEPLENVVGELSQFQNGDGGFGNSIEPDFRMPESSPMATNYALGIFREIEAPSSQPSVANGVRYILSCYDSASSTWPMVSPEVNNHPHAPWWHYNAATGKVPAESTGNPTAEIVSALLGWPELLPAGMLERLTRLCLQRIKELSGEIRMHELKAYIKFVDSLPVGGRYEAERKIIELASRSVAREAAAWARYEPSPLFYVSSPDSFLYAGLQPLVKANLDYLIDTQDPEGGWAPNWEWGPDYSEVWDVACQEWQGVKTLENLRLLKAFGRLAKA